MQDAISTLPDGAPPPPVYVPKQPDKILERIRLRGGGIMILKRWNDHLAIDANGRSLMSSHEHKSEDELGRRVAEKLKGVAEPKVMIGGLGLGYTVRAALDNLPAKAKVVVAELVPEVVRWSRGEVGELAGRPLEDPRVEVIVEDVGQLIRHGRDYDAILLDVDNGPDALVHPANSNLYKRAGLGRARMALRDGGFLAIWSTFPSRTFTHWLQTSGFEVSLTRAERSEGAPRYWIWWAKKK